MNVIFKTKTKQQLNLLGYYLFRRKFFYIKKKFLYRDFYCNQIGVHRDLPVTFDDHYGRAKDYLMDVFQREEGGHLVLDLGCYLAKRLSWFAEQNPHLFFSGMDLAPMTLETAKEKTTLPANVSLVAGDFTHLPFEYRSFDIVFSHLSLYHVPYHAIEKVLKGICRLSRKDVILVEPFHKVQPLPYNVQLLMSFDKYSHDYSKLIKQTGFELKNFVPVYCASENHYALSIFHLRKKN